MKKLHLKILAFSFLLITKIKAQSPGDIIITEFMPDPAKVSDASGEWFEVYNTSNHPIDMNGWYISDGKTKKHTISNTNALTIQTGGFLLFSIKADSTVNGGIIPDYTYSTFTFANSSGKIVISDVAGVVIDSVSYANTSSGKSWNLDPKHFKSNENDNVDNWCTASIAYGKGDMGTPKKMNTVCGVTEISQIVTKQTISLHAMNGELMVVFPDIVEKQKWDIIDITGRVIQSGIASELTGTMVIPLNTNGRGMYFFRLSKSGKTLKFIVE